MNLPAILGVDVDGVLNSSRSCVLKLGSAGWSEEVMALMAELNDIPGLVWPEAAAQAVLCNDPVCVELVNHLTALTGASILLTSSHRAYFTEGCGFGSPEHLRRLGLYLRALGLRAPLLGVTPVLHRPRGEEVQAWLLAREADAPRLALLDDSADYLAGQPLVRVDPEHGVSFSNFVAASNLLGVPQTGLIL